MENKDTNQTKSPVDSALEKSPIFRAAFYFVSHKFDSLNQWINCRTARNSYLLFNVAYDSDKVTELGIQKGDKVVIFYKAVNKDPARPSTVRLTAVDIKKFVEPTDEEKEINGLVSGQEVSEADVMKTAMSSHRATFRKAIANKGAFDCDFYFEFDMKKGDGESVVTTMVFRGTGSQYYTSRFQNSEGLDYIVRVNPGKTWKFFDNEGIMIDDIGSVEEDNQKTWRPTLFLEGAIKVKND